MAGENPALKEAQIRHQLCAIMAHERILAALVADHPTLDEAYFADLRMALINCCRSFGRIHG